LSNFYKAHQEKITKKIVKVDNIPPT